MGCPGWAVGATKVVCWWHASPVGPWSMGKAWDMSDEPGRSEQGSHPGREEGSGARTAATALVAFGTLALLFAAAVVVFLLIAELTRGQWMLAGSAVVVLAFLLWLGVMLAPQAFAAMFTSASALIDFTKHALRIYMACMFLFGIQMAGQMTFTAIGNAKASILVAVMRKFILLLPLIYLVPKFMPSDPTTAVYLAEPIADFFAVSFTAVLFFFQFKKALRALEE